MSHLIASYRLTSAGYDAANTRLLDESGNGNHLPLLAGTPDFTGSYSSKTCFKMHGTAYFGGANVMLPACWTAISVLHPKVLAGESLNYLWASGRVYAANDPGHQTPTQPFEDGTGTTAQFSANYCRVTDAGGATGMALAGCTVTQNTGFVSDAWNVVTDVWNGETSQVKKQWGTGGFASAAIAQHYQVGMLEEMRIGYRPSGLTVAANHLGALRVDIYAGEYPIDDPAGYAARIAALTATPDL